MESVFKLPELDTISRNLINCLSTKIIRIDGPMGSGKTTLISSVCKSLKIQDKVSSPTFSIVNTYFCPIGPVYHFDFYRLDNPNEVFDFGLEEYLDSGHFCFLEWAEKIIPHLPKEYDHFNLEIISNDSRKLIKK